MAKTIGITGVAGGIGQALAKKFSSEGFTVLGIDLLDKCPLDIPYYRCDITNDEEVLRTFEKIKSDFPNISYWFNNAGIARLGNFLDFSNDDFDLVMNVNFRAQVTATRFWLSYFESKGEGVIINMASAAGLIPAGNMASYVASKHAVVGFTRSLQLELEVRRSSVNVVLVTPGFVETGIMQIGAKAGFPEKLKKLISTPESCATEIVSELLKGKKEITPTTSGKIMTTLVQLPFGQNLASLVYKKTKRED
jgi:short-subunit dehydrogenase